MLQMKGINPSKSKPNIDSEAFKNWVSIYNDEIEETWNQETQELRKISMLYSAFQLELKELKDNLSNEFIKIRADLKKRDVMLKCKNFRGFVQSGNVVEAFEGDQENRLHKKVPLQQIDLNEATHDHFFDSPDESPSSSECVVINRSQTSKSPVLNKNQMNNYKRKYLKSPVVIQPALTPEPEANPKESVHEILRYDDLKKCDDDSTILESSVIEETPYLKSFKKPKLVQSTRQNKFKRRKHKQSSTLTQMFMKPHKTKEIDSNLPSMNIDEMLSFINESSSDTNSDIEICDDITVDNLGAAVDAQKSVDTLATFVKNYNKVPEKKTDNPGIMYNEVIRGKERKKLKGWFCQECEKYYKNLNLSPDELQKKMNECSKHRHKFRPRDETYAGFWDLTFGPTPQTPESEKSLLFNYKK